jgi:glutathione-regulated potassium-efflux system ancillary protein KefC
VLTAAITLSMLLTPLLLMLTDRWWVPSLEECYPRPRVEELAEPQDAPVILAGFGRYGQIIGRLLHANGIPLTVLDHDAEQIETLRRFGFRVYYGDVTRLDLLRIAGAAKARVLIVAIDNIEQSLELVDLAQQHFPQLTIVARARNVQHWYQLNERGVRFIERETLDSALYSGRSVLELMGIEPHRARTLAMRFRRHSIEQLHRMAPHRHDESALMSMARAGRLQLEQLFAQERAARVPGNGTEPQAPTESPPAFDMPPPMTGAAPGAPPPPAGGSGLHA